MIFEDGGVGESELDQSTHLTRKTRYQSAIVCTNGLADEGDFVRYIVSRFGIWHLHRVTSQGFSELLIQPDKYNPILRDKFELQWVC